MIVPKQGYKHKYAFGGTGIFESLGNLIKGIVTSQAGKDLTKHLLDSAKNITKTTASENIISKHTRALNPNDAVKINELVKKLNSGMGIKKI